MRRNFCHVSLAFVLKLFNFLQAFVGISIILYSVWMLDQWHRHNVPVSPPPFPAALPPDSDDFSGSHPLRVLNLVADFGFGFGLQSDFIKLPAPWFIYAFMGFGIILCCVTFVGCIAAESIHGCCLCFYTLLKTLLILLEAALVAFIAIDRRWEQDLPFDPTGDLQKLRSFVEDNIDTCKWVGITVITIQALALLLSIILRSMISSRKNDLDEDDYENVRGRTWEPLLNQSGQTSGTHSDGWSTRMREKYGLNSNDRANLINKNA